MRPVTQNLWLHALRPAVLALAGACLACPAWAGAPFVTDDAGTPEAGHFEINLATEYTRAAGGSSGAIPSFEVNYGVTDQLQVSIKPALVFSHVDHGGTNLGFADLELGVKYRFIEQDETGWRPAVAFGPALVLPSGSEIRGLGDGHLQGSLPLWISKDFDRWTVFGGGGYNINQGSEHMNWWFAGLGLLCALDPAWTVGVEVYHATQAERGEKNNTAFNVGVIYNISERHHLMASAGRNLINARDNNEFSTYIRPVAKVGPPVSGVRRVLTGGVSLT